MKLDATIKSLIKFLFYSLLVYLVLYIYSVFIQPMNEYMGARPFDIFPSDIFIGIFLIALLAYNIPTRLKLPSDTYLFIFIIITLIWDISLFRVSGKLGTFGYLLLFFLLFFPIIFFVLIRAISFKFFFNIIRSPSFSRKNYAIFILVILLMISAIVGVISMGGGSFDFASQYERRLQGRVSFGERSIAAYLIQMSLNGIGPVLGFIGAYRKNIIAIMSAFIFSLFGFWLLGTKAPILLTVLLVFFGYLMFKKKHKHVFLWIFFGLFLIIVVSIFEYLFTDYSFIADYFIRRAIVVGSQLRGYYMDYMINNATFDEWLFGINLDGQQITYFIGEYYLNDSTINANTNTFLYILLKSGLGGYFIAVISITIFFLFIDVIYLKYNFNEIHVIALLFSILISEQAYTTAFVSSGIGLTLIILLLFRKEASLLDKKSV